MKLQISKYQALGNDMIVVDPARCQVPMIPDVIRLLCDRHFGVGGDGICFGPLDKGPHPRTMRFFNPDGSSAEKSGNGLRVFARYLWDRNLVTGNAFDVAMSDEVIGVQILDAADKVSLEMGRLGFEQVERAMVFGGRRMEVTLVSIGNPHAVIFSDHLDQIHTLGPLIENAPRFPERINVQLVRCIAPDAIRIEIWERGAGYTLASGTSCCAAAGAAVKTGRCRSPVTVRMAGGEATVMIGEAWQVEMEGEVSAVFEAALSPDMKKRIERLVG
jgi:diaminopimelate epimerase